ncbi:MAG: cobyric acid synthase [Candidatus Acididesulfobacter diazotrophicus]|jgi:adenosylcobyric acid synthase|uniref:Cobyric acid synthase n=1 Tax=Candidatus Acididesulfobacter diazotrophicus TaxID=2597226 RepID=A0A519BPK0_9DELT|nr:MAG: cobyric acid synthase [Candidatus Acididesulfobacter diazotrophicus]
MTDKYLMIQGTSSSAGKSSLTAGFLRYFSNNGFICSPFKPQNMSLNSYVTDDGCEIARSQSMQAEAAGIKPTKYMNPILIKPSENNLMHLIINGKFFGNMTFQEYNSKKDEFIKVIKKNFEYLLSKNDVVIIEGAGSPAEINLYDADVANMGFAELYDIPVILVADIERGGAFASIYGTIMLLPDKWRKLVKGFIINKFRGDESILKPGIEIIEKKVGIQCLGVIPYIENLYIEPEDSLSLQYYDKIKKIISKNYNSPKNNTKINTNGFFKHNIRQDNYYKEGSLSHQKFEGNEFELYENENSKIKVGIIHLDSISNFNEFDPLFLDERFNISFIKESSDKETSFDDTSFALNSFDIIIIPGTKSTISDLKKIKKIGLFNCIKNYYRNSEGIIMGICGGFQMMGKIINDPMHIESQELNIDGFGFFDMETVMQKEKILFNQKYKINNKLDFFSDNLNEILLDGYEIHNGVSFFNTFNTNTIDTKEINNQTEELFSNFIGKGIISKDKILIGTYVHGLFENDIFRNIIASVLTKKKINNENYENKYNKNLIINKNSSKNKNNDFSYQKIKNYNFELLAEILETSVNMPLIKTILRLP